ncbi:hypothetical protein [Streptomyces sp. NPDC059224]|uniref:hypothetical protein n=1 Tax=Streptomyces sp. NPDC059224 TaxID=3346775 RepID=UPI00368F3CDE
MTLFGIPPAGMRRAMAPESGRDHAHAIAEAAHAWWTANRGGSSDRAIAVGTLAALALSAPSRPDGPDYGPLLLPLDDEQVVDTLRAGWNSFWTYDPDLTEAARPLHDWLSHPNVQHLRQGETLRHLPHHRPAVVPGLPAPLSTMLGLPRCCSGRLRDPRPASLR